MAAAAAPAAAARGPLSIPSLDGIRACSVMLVFVTHAVMLSLTAYPSLQHRIPGDFGVTVFFFLSGYLITTLLRVEHERTGRISLRDFYLRRVLRIFPPFYLVLIVATLLTVIGALPGQLTPQGIGAQVVYLTNYDIIQHGWWLGRAPGTWIFWSLCIEEHFYLVFPLLYLLLLRVLPSRRRQALVLAGICVAVMVWRIMLIQLLGAQRDRTYLATDTRIDSILFGCILGVWANPVLDRTRVGHMTWKLLWVPLALLGLLVSFAVRSPTFQNALAYTMQGVCLFPLFIAAVRYHDWEFFRLLNRGWVKFVGVLSYSIYLMHPAVLWALSQRTSWLPGPLQAAVGLAITLALAYLVYRVVERPAARLRRRLSRIDGPVRPVRPAAAASVAVPANP
jgi:peptidoglycan/LPS O-acetylase OafA/YrhL